VATVQGPGAVVAARAPSPHATAGLVWHEHAGRSTRPVLALRHLPSGFVRMLCNPVRKSPKCTYIYFAYHGGA
jgi:hypothetical protein